MVVRVHKVLLLVRLLLLLLLVIGVDIGRRRDACRRHSPMVRHVLHERRLLLLLLLLLRRR